MVIILARVVHKPRLACFPSLQAREDNHFLGRNISTHSKKTGRDSRLFQESRFADTADKCPTAGQVMTCVMNCKQDGCMNVIKIDYPGPERKTSKLFVWQGAMLMLSECSSKFIFII